MASSTADRLDALERENAALRARLAAVEGSRAEPEPAPPTYRPPEVSIRHVPTSRFVMPSSDELRELHAIAARAYPQLVTPPGRFEDAEAPLRAFRAAFIAVNRLGRLLQPDSSRALSWFLDYARFDAEGADGSGGYDGPTFLLGAIASGDVAFRAWSPSSAVELGLTYSGAGRPAGDAWRRVLASGRVPDPVAPAREPQDHRGVVERHGVAVG